MALSLGKVALTTHLNFIYAVFAFIAVKYFKLNILWIFIVGLLFQFVIIKGIL